MGQTLRRWSWPLPSLVVLLVVTPLTACSLSTPLCTAAAGLVTDGRLTAAEYVYGEARKSDEGDCAGDGIERVAGRRKQAAGSDATGRAAVRRHDRTRAAAAFRAALKIDRNDADAVAGLLKLGTAPSAPVAGPVTIVTTPVTGGPSIGALRSGCALALITSLALAIGMWWTRRRAGNLRAESTRIRKAGETSPRTTSSSLISIERQVRARLAQVSAAAESADLRVADLEADMAKLRERVDRAEQGHRDALLLAHQLFEALRASRPAEVVVIEESYDA
ncbi:hypothetical protein ACWT_3398 [Actinoplanes sp. SE50]|uniref:hypothetical protein n=1 Tax=unclassified Actinoplanes TaxID=2626549 RepID=UPI00023ED422|nr:MULTISPECIES: hypothetical protein [unclassified Actinoplanes]AEV84421.1 hypothetical protein ACPL_3526 [Actinoplanes sp. SE50/110]ATO82813.1 hypothetical protein ACWT_3398 [Actinoplanes sp. SE50]SLM00221.1 hypothetical protein ACSP50_3453 [Actinoplanes sp. SE50/110]